jgi:uncharacterized membrane protein YagU involved in acid resistance
MEETNMEGIEIIASEQFVTHHIPNFAVCAIVSGVVLLITIIIGFILMIYWRDKVFIALGVMYGMLISVFVFLLMCPFILQPYEYETRYTVVISDDVSMIEFNERYEIIAQKNYDTFIVRERE